MNDVLKMVVCPVVVLFCAVVEIVCPFIGHADGSQQVPMLRGLSGWQATPVVTIGEFLPTRDLNASGGKYRLVGSMDGLGAYALDSRTVRVLVNHELARQAGYPYLLRNGTSLTGARVSFIDIDRKTRQPVSSGLAFNTVYDRQGLVVTQSQQMSLTSETTSGLSSLCSAQLVEGGQKGFADTIFFTHEESPDPLFHPYGGTLWALDVASQELYAVPAAGRMAWENTAALDIGGERVALLIGDDSLPQTEAPQDFGMFATIDISHSHVVAAPLWLFVGKKNASLFEIRKRLPSPSRVHSGFNEFLNRNGLLIGDLYYFVAVNGKTTVDDFHGTGAVLSGTWIKIDVHNSLKAGKPGFDELGYKNGFTLRREAKAGGAFQFSRPEDVSTHPLVGTRAVFSSTGRDAVFPHDAWGTLYQVDVDFESMAATIRILYDGDDSGGGQVPGPDFGIRNPDNLDWADDGFIYVQEDKAKIVQPWFGSRSGEEASVWRLNPRDGRVQRIAQIDRSIPLPARATDRRPNILGAWESSGIVDVTALFDTQPGERLFLATVQAHSVRDGSLAQAHLVEGGQLVFLNKQRH